MNEVYDGYKNQLKNKYFALLREREKKGEWEKFLDSILIELMGFKEDEITINWYRLFRKTSSLKYLSYGYFRKTIFECMNLIEHVDDMKKWDS